MNIVNKLKLIVFLLSILTIFNIIIIYTNVNQIIYDSRVVNYSGIVRGGSQKFVKNEIAYYYDNNASDKIDIIIDGLINGSNQLKLPPASDPHFLEQIKSVQQEWENIKLEIKTFRDDSQHKEQLIKVSEDFWKLTNSTTFIAEDIAFKNIKNIKNIQLFLFVLDGLVLFSIYLINRNIAKQIITKVKTENQLKLSEENLRQSLKQNQQYLLDLNNKNLALEEAIKKATSANQAKSLFLANMSHEIKTPLNLILGYTELLKKEVTNPKQIHHINSINYNSDFLLYIINDILNFSKIESGELEVNYEQLNLKILFENIIYIFTEKIKQKKISFIGEIDKGIPEKVEFDQIKLRQILFNLIGNAIKFTEQGYIKIRVSSYVKSLLNTCSITIEIEDTGIGIASDKQKIIFNSFQQSSETISRKYGGTGLGLSITKKLTEILGGTITLHSELGKGSKFTLFFPSIKIISHQSSQSSILPHDFELTTNQKQKANKPITIKKKNIAQESLNVLPKLLKKIAELQEDKWLQINQTMNVKEIKIFLTMLQALQVEYDYYHLTDYVHKLSQAVEQFDPDKMSDMIKIFPGLREQILEDLRENNNDVTKIDDYPID